ncbi:MAG: YraN family protein [Sphingobacteriales bacterium]|nr:MAG: YraN family protein [Sphingobacteriales bacterium]
MPLTIFFLKQNNMSTHNDLGALGESLAWAYLRAKGHIILQTNFRIGHKEIDVISLCGDILVFTEIKARSTYAFGYPEEAVSRRKQQLVKQAAEFYCLDHPQYTQFRFDILSLLIQKNEIQEAVHFEDAFY